MVAAGGFAGLGGPLDGKLLAGRGVIHHDAGRDAERQCRLFRAEAAAPGAGAALAATAAEHVGELADQIADGIASLGMLSLGLEQRGAETRNDPLGSRPM